MNINSAAFAAKKEAVEKVKKKMKKYVEKYGGPGSGRRPEGGGDGNEEKPSLKGSRLSATNMGQGNISIEPGNGKQVIMDNREAAKMKVGEIKTFTDPIGREFTLEKVDSGKFNVKMDGTEGYINLNRYDD